MRKARYKSSKATPSHHGSASARANPSLQLNDLIEELALARAQLRLQDENIHALLLELEASQDRYFELYEFAPIALVSLDRNGLIVGANTTAMQLLQYKPRALIGRPMISLVAPEDRLSFLNYMRVCRREGQTQSRELTILTVSKTPRRVQLITRQVVMDDLRTPTYATAINPIGQESRLREQLRALAASLSLTEERERRRIAVEIHDRISQKLALVKMQLSGVRQSVAPGAEAVLEGVLQLMGELLEDTRRLTFELSPPVLYELGFVPAIEWLAEQFQQAHKVDITVDCETPISDLANDLRVLLFQCTRELLNNVVKHSHAKHAKITLRQDPREIYLSISDDGVGFDAAGSQIPPSGITSFGLFSIRQRIEEIGGSFRVLSRDHAGTTARITIALHVGANGEIGSHNEDQNLTGGRPPDRETGTQESARPASGHGSGRRGGRRSQGRRAG
jgi:PAS domain S-box-containing protein